MITYKLNTFGDYAEKLIDGVSTGEWHNINNSQEYLKWLEEGNTPLPADEPADEISE
jgi:hypothetical protein